MNKDAAAPANARTPKGSLLFDLFFIFFDLFFSRIC